MNLDIMKGFKPRTGNNVGLDIGTHSIKMVEISGSSDKLSLVSFGVKKVRGLSAELISDSIRTMSDELNISVRDVNISLAGPSVVERVVSMPDMSGEELKNAVRFETEKSIPFDINECTLDFFVQGKDRREEKSSSILLAAAKRDSVLEKIKIVEDAGLSVNVIDTDSFAITNAFMKNFSSVDAAKTIAILNIGDTYTNLIIMRGGLITFVRGLTNGVSDFRSSVLKKCGVDLEQCDGLKGVPSEKSAEVAIAAKSALTSLVDDIKLSFGYHENQSGHGIDQIFISGGGSSYVELDGAFYTAFGIKPEMWNPVEFLDIDPSVINVDEIAKINSSLAVAAGLSLRGRS